MEFPWRCNVDTIAMDLKVSWEMSVYLAFWIPSLSLTANSSAKFN